MSRIARVVVVGLPHHITQRGNYKQDVFIDDDDRQQYLNWLQEYSFKYGLSVIAYCLMNNHVHFVAIPAESDSLAKTFNTLHMRYSQYFNRKLKQSGHLWQGRFYSCVLDQPHLLLAVKYIENNPVRARIVKKPWQWEWSSAQAHIAGDNSLLQLGDLFKIADVPFEAWKQYIDTNDDEKILKTIRKHTLTGRPLGMPDRIKNLELSFGRRLAALPIGRPKKTKE